MEVKEHGETYNVTIEAGETVSITIGTVNKEWTVATGKRATFQVRFHEEIIQA
jgi:hypothetical protein